MGESTRIESTLRGIPLKLLEMYLQDLGGVSVAPGQVEGPGWQASMERIDDFQLGSIRVGQVRYTLEGDLVVVESLQAKLERKLLRAGA